MNEVFDWTRFCKVVRKDFMNIWSRAGKLLLVQVCMPVALFAMVCAFSNDPVVSPEVRFILIGGLAMLLCCMFPSVMYRSCNLPKQGMYFAMLPASHLEKYLSMLLHCLVVAPVLLVVGACLSDTVLSLLPFGPYKDFIWQWDYMDWHMVSQSIPEDAEFLKDFFFGGRFALLCLLAIWTNHMVFVFTNTIFKSHKFVLTILAIWALEVVLNIVGVIISFAVSMNLNFEYIEAQFLASPEHFFNLLTWGAFVCYILVCAGLMVWTYFRLKKMKY